MPLQPRAETRANIQVEARSAETRAETASRNCYFGP